MARRGRRDLSPEEKRLWEHVARHVTPLERVRQKGHAGDAGHGFVMPEQMARDDVSLPAMEKAGRQGATRDMAKPAASRPEGKPSAPPRPPVLPAYRPPVSQKQTRPVSGPGGLDRKERRALRRRVREIEAKLDLHGMRQEEAHRALIRFLQASSARDCAIVLIVTGKGGVAGPGFGDERGILRRMVPHWLRAQELRPFVVGFEEAAAHHGGAGAIYVRLRRRG